MLFIFPSKLISSDYCISQSYFSSRAVIKKISFHICRTVCN